MKDIERVHALYLKIDSLLAAEESNIASTTFVRDKWSQARNANEQAHFALLFAQFEDVVNTFCKVLVHKKGSSARWTLRRSWEIIEIKDITRVSFLNRVALLCEKGDTDYNTVSKYYRLRCSIDHGEVVPSIMVTTVKDDLMAIAKRMKKYA